MSENVDTDKRKGVEKAGDAFVKQASKTWQGPTTGTDSFFYFIAWCLLGLALLSTLGFSSGMAGIQVTLLLAMPLLVLGLGLLMKIAGYLKRIEELLSAAIPEDEKESGEAQQQHHDTGAAGAC